MNVRTATLLSIAGVLAAGTAAVAVNTQVLSGSTDPVDLSTALTLPVSTQVFAVPSPGGESSSTPADPMIVRTEGSGSVSPQAAVEQAVDQPVTTTVPAKASPSTQAPSSLMAFQIGDAATATVDTAGGVLTIVDVTPNTGWKVVAATGSGTVRLSFELTSTSTRVTFGAFLSGGEVLTSIASESLAPPSAHHDDDDDDHHDADHDDDHDDDHDRGDDDD